MNKVVLDLDNDDNYIQIHGILELSLQHCVVLERWKTAVSALIEKKTGTPYIHKFRVIHVVEGDLQFLSKYFYSLK